MPVYVCTNEEAGDVHWVLSLSLSTLIFETGSSLILDLTDWLYWVPDCSGAPPVSAISFLELQVCATMAEF